MSTAAQFEPISVSDYLVGERSAKRKHEYVYGVVYAMAGGSNRHNRIASNAIVSLGGQLVGEKCEAFNSDTKVRVRQSAGTRFYYPDVTVVCDPNSDADSFHDHPVVVIEVISESTRRTDEHEKRDAYLSIDSLCVYVLIEQANAAAQVYRRADSGFDREVYLGLDAVIPLPEIDSELRLGDVYQNVVFTDNSEADEDSFDT
ncbi:hypothetical protein LF1_29270 [Rubripirellula obstinata]|uniref:Putative restriction endonuclease domain-containing protein n=1 Tax=Rubripirellula obstinata TaxID=406547 RepID=A0A5B1CGR2_9BACT|nr:Uma2 family endonuclease [Rubripirellula obstinata]KAA1260387.1 hypothetical protein LF1_29270 [Rubripirellula obstinata]